MRLRIACSLAALAGWLGASPAAAQQAADAQLAQAAYQVLKTHCYSCHGVKLVVPKFNILDRQLLIETPAAQERERPLVKPGDPKGSLVWHKLGEEKSMPPEDVLPRPTPVEIETVRKWIAAGALFPAVTARPFLSEAQVLTLVRGDLQSVAAADRKFQRYLTLANLHNNPALTDDDLALARAGLVKLLNSVSKNAQLVFPKLIDAPPGTPHVGAIFRLDLRDLNWEGDAWRKVLKSYPYGLVPRPPQLSELTQDLERLWEAQHSDGVSVIRGDWFAFAASRGDNYHNLLGLPLTIQELEKQLGIDRRRDFTDGRVRRAGFAGGGVSRHNRLIDRNRSQTTAYYYRSFDFGKAGGRSNLYTFPLGPASEKLPFAEAAFQEDGGEVIWRLPNGLQGYFIIDPAGKRLNEAPVSVVRDLSEISGSPAVVNGVSCIGCHRDGLQPYRDTVRQWSGVAGEAAQHVQRIYAANEEIEQFLAADNRQFQAVVESLVGPYLQAAAPNQSSRDFPEPVLHLVRLYLKDLTRAEVAYELGFDHPDKLPLDNNPRLRELGLLPLKAGGKIPRDVWDSRIDSPATLFQRTAVALELGSGINPF